MNKSRQDQQKVEHRHDVDVSQAITTLLWSNRGEGPPSSKDVSYATFQFSTDSGRVVFASREWNGGDAEPELIILLADDTVSQVAVSVLLDL